MGMFLKYLFFLLFWVISSQIYCFAVHQTGVQKQEGCQKLGILYLTIGIMSLVSRTMLSVVSGFILIMLGLRLLSYSLDRINKTTFIDRYGAD